MGLESYEKAKRLILENPELADFNGACSDELIISGQNALGLEFSGSYLKFLKDFSVGSFDGDEFYGLVSDDFENSGVPDVVWYTLRHRLTSNLPKHLIMFYDIGDGTNFCLDYTKLNDEGEPKVVWYDPGYPPDEQTYDIEADSFGEFLLQSILSNFEG